MDSPHSKIYTNNPHTCKSVRTVTLIMTMMQVYTILPTVMTVIPRSCFENIGYMSMNNTPYGPIGTLVSAVLFKLCVTSIVRASRHLAAALATNFLRPTCSVEMEAYCLVVLAASLVGAWQGTVYFSYITTFIMIGNPLVIRINTASHSYSCGIYQRDLVYLYISRTVIIAPHVCYTIILYSDISSLDARTKKHA